MDSSSAEPKKKTAIGGVGGLGVGLALCAGLALRVWPPLALGRFWHDEVFTVAVARCDWRRIIHLTAGDVHPPLYYFVIHSLMAVGRWVGGIFVDDAFLRGWSVLCGAGLVALGWWFAGRWRGAAFARWVAVLFALSPVLCYFSAELRSFAMLMLLVFGATAVLAEMVLGPPGGRWRLALLYAALMTAACYTHVLALVYGAGHAVWAVWELARHRGRGGWRAWAPAAAAGVLPLVAFAPWGHTLLRQARHFEGYFAGQMFLGDGSSVYPTWREWISTVFFYLPYGPYGPQSARWAWEGWPRIAMLATLAAVGLMAGLRLAAPLARGGRHSSAPSRVPSLLAPMLLMTLVPLGAACALNLAGRGWIFHPFRYNQLAAPYAIFALAELAWGLRWPRLRKAALVLIALIFAGAAVGLQRDRNAAYVEDSYVRILRDKASHDGKWRKVYWIDPDMARWFHRYEGVRLLDYMKAKPGDAEGDRVLFVTARPISQLDGIEQEQDAGAREILNHSEGVRSIDTKGAWAMPDIWQVEPEAFPAILSRLQAMQDDLETSRRLARAGLCVPAFADQVRYGKGWYPGVWLNRGEAFAIWMKHEARIRWRGPARPGRYRIVAQFERIDRRPEAVNLKMHVTGASGWVKRKVNPALFVIQTTIEVTKPRQWLEVRFKTPTWVPSEWDPGNPDDRELGMLFEGLRLEPVETGSGKK